MSNAMRTQMLTLLIISLLSISSIHIEEQLAAGEYEMIVNISKYDFGQNVATADIQINANLPAGTGFVYIPLPFSRSAGEEFIIEPISSSNLVLYGHIRPAERYGVVQIVLTTSASHVIISMRNVQFPLQETARAESNKAIVILINEAYSELDTVINGYTAPQLSSLTINGANIQNTEPPANNAGIQRGYTIDFPQDNSRPPNVTIFLTRKQNQQFLYIVLSSMGIFLGIFAAPRLANTKRKATWTLILAALGLITLVVVFFAFLTPEQRFSDTTTIVTTGSASGLLVGFVIESIWFLYSH